MTTATKPTEADSGFAELEAFRAKTRSVIAETTRRKPEYLTPALRDEALANLGLPPILPPQTVMVEVAMTRRLPVTVDDCASYEDAADKVRAMDAETITAKLRAPGGYVSHRVLSADEAPSDPLSWVTLDNSGASAPQRREAIKALAEEVTDLGSMCTVYTPADRVSYHCSRGRGHAGQHIAAGGTYVLDVWPAGLGRDRY